MFEHSMVSEAAQARWSFRHCCARGRAHSAFTLIELMIVVSIMALILTMSIPLVGTTTRKEGLRQAVSDVVEVCSHARAMAILQGAKTEVLIYPKERRLAVSGGGGAARSQDGEDFGTPPPATAASNRAGLTATIPDNLVIEMLDVNLSEYKDADLARVVFYPNGTCDEFTLIIHSDHNEYRKISLEVTTGLATVEADPHKFK